MDKGLQIIQDIQNDSSINKMMEVSLKENKNRGMSVLTNIVKNNYQLQDCSKISVAAAVVDIMSIGLDPIVGTAYVIPYSKKATVQIGYLGYIQMALRTDKVAKINARAVREGQFVGENFLTGDYEFQSEAKSDKIIGYMAYLKLTNGFEKTLYWTAEEMHIHFSKHSKNNYDEVKRKWMENKKSGKVSDKMTVEQKGRITMLKQILRIYSPKNTYVEKALMIDEKIYQEDDIEVKVVEKKYTFATEEQVKKLWEFTQNLLAEKEFLGTKDANKRIKEIANKYGAKYPEDWNKMQMNDYVNLAKGIERDLKVKIIIDNVRISEIVPAEIVDIDD